MAEFNPFTPGMFPPQTLTPTQTQNESERELVNRMYLRKKLEETLHVDNPDKAWFTDIIKNLITILAKIARKQQDQGLEITPEVRAVIDMKALAQKGTACLTVSKGGKGKPPRGLVDPKCVKEGQWVYTNNDGVEKVYRVEKGTGGHRVWKEISGLSSSLKEAYREEQESRTSNL